VFDLNYTQTTLIESVWFIAYGVASVPSAFLIERGGYKKAIVIGLIIMAAGAFGMVPAARIPSYEVTLVALFVVACGKQYPHDPVICTSDSECATGHKCLPEWEQSDAGSTDGGVSCLSTKKSCQKPCTTDDECSYCGFFGVCASNVCDQTKTTTCGSFCGDAK
jgi:hypothetical protein